MVNTEDLWAGELGTTPVPSQGLILVAGATGYIGGLLVPELLGRGYRVRVMARVATTACAQRWPAAEMVVADALEPQALGQALKGVHTAYYLIHSMLRGRQCFEEADIEAAHHFRRAAEENGVKRIIYLGSLGDRHSKLSSHLSSRMKVAEEFLKSSIPSTILRAAIIIGSGSASYEMINHLVRRVPLFPTPSWAYTRCQPIAVRDVILYLVGVLELPETAGCTFDIGGTEVLTYKQILQTHAAILGKRRLFFPFPISNIPLYSYITSFITPVPASIIWSLMEGVRSDVICQNRAIEQLLTFRHSSCREALVLAISREEQDAVRTRWSDSYPPAYELAMTLGEMEGAPTYCCTYSLVTEQRLDSLFESMTHIGGKKGWFHSTFLWRVRGWIDRMLLGVGTARGRRSASTLRVNDVVDFWRVEQLVKDEQLLLRAELKTPGKAWLEFRVSPISGRKNRLSVNAYYYTNGFWGRSYWYLFLPFHHFIFVNLIRQIERSSRLTCAPP
jgi:uncharacterized protein YbjT (DUF2867 family)